MATTKKSAAVEGTEPPKLRKSVRRISTARQSTESPVAHQLEPVGSDRSERASALTIHIQSWATPVVGLVMLVMGLLIGYFVRPLTLAQAATPAVSAALATAPVTLPTADQSAARQALMASLLPKVRHFQGDPKAPVTMIEFGDFQCPFCGRYASEVNPQVQAQYVQTGKVRFGFVNFAFLGSESTWAAEAAECASDQGKYWQYHDKLYSSQGGENQGAFSKDHLKQFAQELGLDPQTFNDCLDSDKYAALIQSDTGLSSSLGVQSTPTFVVNGESVVGAQPFEVFQQTFDTLLKQP